MRDSQFGNRYRSLVLLFVIGLLVRTIVVVDWSQTQSGVSLAPSLSEDTDSYVRLAVNWSASGAFGFEAPSGRGVAPTAFRPPLYPWLLSWLVIDGELAPTCVAVLNIVLGLATIILTWAIGRKLRLRWAWLAALAVAVDPLLLRASQSPMTETLAALCVVIAWRLWLVVWPPRPARETRNECGSSARSSSQWFALAALSIVFGLSVLARPTAAPWVVLCAVTALLIGCRCWKRRVLDVAVLCLGVAICVVPWTLRNWALLGKPIWATTHGGYTLLLANNPPLYAHFGTHGPDRGWDAEPFHATWAMRAVPDAPAVDDPDFWNGGWVTRSQAGPVAIGELEDDRLAYEAAWATILGQPGMFAASCIYRAAWLWAPWPNQGSWTTRLAIGGWYLAWFVLATIGLWRVQRTAGLRNWLVWLLLCVSLTAVHAVYWSNMRMRASAMAGIYLLAATAVAGRTEQE